MTQKLSRNSESKLANYLSSTAAVGAAAAVASTSSTANAVVVANTTPVPFGINEEVNIDFNGDGLIEFQIDHDRVTVDGMDLDFLQIDKNDASSAANPLPVDGFAVFPGTFTSPRLNYNGDGVWNSADITAWQGVYGTTGEDIPGDGNNNDAVEGQDFLIAQQVFGTDQNYDMEYFANLNNCNHFGSGGCHPAALEAGATIGPDQDDQIDGQFMFSESTNSFGNGTALRPNRLIDEDAGQVDLDLGVPAETPLSSPEFTGLNGEVRYLGVRMDLNDEGFRDNPFPGANGPSDINDPSNYWYGWIGIQITNEADATGVVTGWAYEDQLGTAIIAGDTGVPPASSTVPEPTSIVTAALGGVIASGFAWRKLFRNW